MISTYTIGGLLLYASAVGAVYTVFDRYTSDTPTEEESLRPFIGYVVGFVVLQQLAAAMSYAVAGTLLKSLGWWAMADWWFTEYWVWWGRWSVFEFEQYWPVYQLLGAVFALSVLYAVSRRT